MKVVMIFLLLCFALTSFSQGKMQAGISKNDFLRKSKKQKTIGWIFLGGGAALVTTGLLIPEGDVTGFSVYPDWSDTHENDGIKAALSLTGVLSMLGSIPFFIASSKNKRRAGTTVSFNSQRILLPRQSAFVTCVQPALTLKIGM